MFILEAHPLPDGSQVLVPKIVRPRCCSRADGISKIRTRRMKKRNWPDASIKEVTGAHTIFTFMWRPKPAIGKNVTDL